MARSRPRTKWWRSKKHWIIAGSAVILLLLIVLYQFFSSVHEDQWLVEKDSIETVTSSTYMRQVNRSFAFHGDIPYTIVYGTDPDGRAMIAWVSAEGVHAEYESDGITEEEARKKVLAQTPDAEILRASPGVYEGVYVWEVFYKRQVEQGIQHYYDYYRFQDGHYIETYKLAVQRD
jgi:uncharacterized protein YpmB